MTRSTPKARPKTGEARATRQPLKIDRLPTPVHDAILYLRNSAGKTWEEIEAQSAEPFAKSWRSDGGGFVDWQQLPLAVLELFPQMRLPHTNLHRWYDIRFAQVRHEVMVRSAEARKIAEAFVASVVSDSDQSVLNAARDTIMAILAEDGSAYGRIKAGKALISLAEVMQSARANDIKERKVAVDERKMAQLEAEMEARRKRAEAETESMAKKYKGGNFSLDDINALRSRAFGLPPVDAEGKVVAK